MLPVEVFVTGMERSAWSRLASTDRVEAGGLPVVLLMTWLSLGVVMVTTI